jgi:phage portal protein BeeE
VNELKLADLFKRKHVPAYQPLDLPFEKKSLDYSKHEPQLQNRSPWGGWGNIKNPNVAWTNPEDFSAVAKKLFFECSASRSCLEIRSKKVASVPITVLKGSTASKALIASPNAVDHNLTQSMIEWEISLSIGGDLFIWFDQRIRSRPQMWTLRQDFMDIDPASGWITYNPGKLDKKSPPERRFLMEGGRCARVERNVGNGNVLEWVKEEGSLFHIMEHNPLSSIEGSGAGDAVLKAVEAHIEAMAMIHDRMVKRGRKEGYINAPALLTDEEKAAYQSSMAEFNPTGQLNVLLDSEFIENQLTFSELDLVNTVDTLTRQIASGFNVPAVFLNLFGESNFANQRGADRIYYTGWVKPRALWLIKQIEANLRRDFDPTLELGIDETAVNYLQDDRLEKATALAQLGSFSQNEIRAVMGYGEIPGGDAIAKPAWVQSGDDNKPTDEPSDKPKEVSPNADTSRRNGQKSRVQ